MEGLGSIYLHNKLEASLMEALRCCGGYVATYLRFQDNWGVKLAYAGAPPVNKVYKLCLTTSVFWTNSYLRPRKSQLFLNPLSTLSGPSDAHPRRTPVSVALGDKPIRIPRVATQRARH